VSHVSWSGEPRLREPILIAAFEGWNDAGDAATTAARFLASRWNTRRFADIDPEEFYDFTGQRPIVRIDEGDQRELIWPENTFQAGHINGTQRDAIVFLGIEPQLKWRTYCDTIMEVIDEYDPGLVITLGALIAEVPHTRPVPVVGTGYRADVVDRLNLQPSNYEGPTGIVGVFHNMLREADRASVSLWATVPSYVPSAPSPKATLALVNRICTMLGTSVPTTDLEIASSSYERQVTSLVSEDDDTAAYVVELERRHDEEAGELRSDDAESLVEEVEQFLKNRPEDT
jgi:predicted ATP-grasp superfamily ATP-dependent carboligase